MFDSIPQTSATRAVPALTPTQRNQGERRTVLYIEDMYDPDKHPIADKDKYVVPYEDQLVVDVPAGYWYRCEQC